MALAALRRHVVKTGFDPKLPINYLLLPFRLLENEHTSSLQGR